MKFRQIVLLGLALCFSAPVFAQNEQCNTDFSLYREAFKQWENSTPKYDRSNISPVMLNSWRNVFLNCPTLRQTTFIDGVKIVINALILPTKDKELRNKYVDTLIMVYDKRAEYFPTTDNGASQLGNISGRKGIDLMSIAPDRYEDAYNALKKAIELDGEKSNPAFINAYFGSVINMVKNDKLTEDVILDEYGRLMDLVDANIKVYTDMGNEKQLNNYKATKADLDAAVQPFANCEDLIRIYQAKFDAAPNDVDLLNKIAAILEKKGCDDSQLYLDVAINLHKMDPSPASAYFIGKRYLTDKEYAKAKPYFLEATKSENVDWAANSYKYLAQIMLIDKNYSQGREYAKKAIALNKADGEPYIIIGNLYAASAKECGSGDFYSKVAFWAAVDQFNKAKSIDPSIKSKADELITLYSHYFPNVETIFFNGFEEGQQYTVECWINETTTVRAVK